MIQVGELSATVSPHDGRHVTPAAMLTAVHPRDHAGTTTENSAPPTLQLLAVCRACEESACSMPLQSGTQEVVLLTT